MIDTNQRVADGWYPDPEGRLSLRRWDGAQWTQETRGNLDWGRPVASLDLPSRHHPDAPETGWAGVAFALHSALVSREAVALRIGIAEQSTITVDTFEQSYVWDDEPASLPAIPANVRITFSPSDLAAQSQGRNLDGLLWRISREAFADRLAPWLQPDDLYRLQRWPNLTTINPELDDMRQAAMLANGMFTVEELAGFSDRSLHATRALINALSLMNTLRIAAPRDTAAFVTPAAPAPAPAAPARKPGLFQRLRARLGL
ncbi:DUF2510 domain-containing protein [Leucobacter weissii]|uniref:DUF2510 domain-containing protein n=1 Tax=Leucobacter weissii TaxID=1983706 RepID=A0A939S9P1_9MICO|nr:DUF2510 domain-containing protein [Leucobacter weissii]MBO1901122.1 DUF2510 domain-containing protein [Leucobacter weissii]